ncbi:hypothetical protein HQ585_07095 [candidate division KSB1 bacterium]|nr:hypothetical protein [candidate division KSB1 bacterium]
MNRIAVIDIGTQSVLFLLAETISGKLHRIGQSAVNVRMGQLDVNNNIQQERLDACAGILLDLKAQAEVAGTEHIITTGTAVFRNASNGHDAAQFLSKRTGLHVEVLSEADEALLSFKGAMWNRNLDGRCWVFDVGGGSTECILGSKEHLEKWTSLPLGAVSMNQMLSGDPPEPETVTLMQNRIVNILSSFNPIKSESAETLIGVGGTITTLAAMELTMSDYDSDRIDGMTMTRFHFEKWMDFIRRTPVKNRCEIPGLSAGRTDIIMAGTAIFLSILELTGHTQIMVSDRGLRHGVLMRELAKIT